MANKKPVDGVFVQSLPKIELHAHLTGSISRECLHNIWQRKKLETPELPLGDPLETLPIGKVDFNIHTFFPVFDTYIYHLCNDIESIRYSTKSVLENFRDDGVRYLELRTTPREHAATNLSKDDYVSTVLNCIEDFGRSEMSVYLILSIDRKNTVAEADQVVNLAIKYRSRGVVGIDLCGNPARELVSDLSSVFEKARSNGLKITLHFGETASSGSEKELAQLLSYQPSRLGHVICIPEAIKKEMIARKLCLELCLSCNVLAEMTSGGFPNHHFGYWKNTDCPIILCTDDVGIFCSPLSNEYLHAAKHFNLSRLDLVNLCRRGISSIFAGEEEQQRLRDYLQAAETDLQDSL